MATPLRKHLTQQEDNLCNFERAWRGRCTNQIPCKEHTNLNCCSCGSPATHDCPETFSLVCGAPLCGDCEHVIFPDGTSGGYCRLPKELKAEHVRKTDQIYKPWYMRTEETGS